MCKAASQTTQRIGYHLTLKAIMTTVTNKKPHGAGQDPMRQVASPRSRKGDAIVEASNSAGSTGNASPSSRHSFSRKLVGRGNQHRPPTTPGSCGVPYSCSTEGYLIGCGAVESGTQQENSKRIDKSIDLRGQVSASRQTARLSLRALEPTRQSLGTTLRQGSVGALCCSAVVIRKALAQGGNEP